MKLESRADEYEEDKKGWYGDPQRRASSSGVERVGNFAKDQLDKYGRESNNDRECDAGKCPCRDSESAAARMPIAKAVVP